MSIGDAIRTFGGRLGLIKVNEMADNGAKNPAKIVTRTVSIKDLTTEVRQDEVKLLAETPAELAVPFEKVFDAAGIKPPTHGWTVERLTALLATDQYKGMDRTNVQKAVLGLLSTEKVPVEDIVKDAVARDHAIDAYDTFTHKKMDDRAAAREHHVAELQAQIKDLQNQCATAANEAKSDIARRREWIDRKIAYEKEMAATLSYLLDHPVISITEPEGR
jgi:hypothetical protein